MIFDVESAAEFASGAASGSGTAGSRGSVEFTALPPAMIRQQWTQDGVPYRRAAAESEHLMQTESPSRPAISFKSSP